MCANWGNTLTIAYRNNAQYIRGQLKCLNNGLLALKNAPLTFIRDGGNIQNLIPDLPYIIS